MKDNTEQDITSTQVDEYHYEEKQEREAMMKGYHHPMKLWYKENINLINKYGPFPIFWQDLREWTPYNEVLKAYMKATDSNTNKNNENPIGKDVNNTENGQDLQSDPNQLNNNETCSTTSEISTTRKRRRSRWEDAAQTTEVKEIPVASAPPVSMEKKKKSRWAPPPSATNNNPMSMAERAVSLVASALATSSAQSQQLVLLRAKLDALNQRLQTVAVDAARIEKDPSRSPSPPPQYDSNGKRTNTREVRMRAALEKSRQAVIEEMLTVNPNYKPPSDFVRQKLNRKIYIPIKEYPNYNFIGLIIGPRGNTQKRMERETNCKIAIRGRGSVKEGSRGKNLNPDDNDDLHVLIMGDREEDLDKAAKEVQSLLVPVDDTKNSHKQKQLRELALINGTYRDDDYCHICGEKGHRQWECPNRDQQSFKAADVKCAICGDSSHVTRDCTQEKKDAAQNAVMDKEYESFMEQLSGKSVISTATKTVEAAAPWLKPATAISKDTNVASWNSTNLPPGVGAPSIGGAPGTYNAAPGTQNVAPGTQNTAQISEPPALGSTPATAFPPPVAIPIAQHAMPTYGYVAHDPATWAAMQQQNWQYQHYAAYGGWDQSQLPHHNMDYQYSVGYNGIAQTPITTDSSQAPSNPTNVPHEEP